jgi:hypothetical protein
MYMIGSEDEMAKVKSLTHERLTEVLDFDPATGVFVWKMRTSNRIQIGDRAGVVGTAGYRLIAIDGTKFQATRLAWFYVHREWPEGDIVLLNGNLDDVSIGNLKDMSRVDSARLRGAQSNNTSGFKGVSRSAAGRWQAKIVWGYKAISLGTKFKTPEEASDVYEEAARRLVAAASAEGDRDHALMELKLWRRQRAAWRLLERTQDGHGWKSFEAFCSDVRDIPAKRFAMAPVDPARPIGPSNFKWALPMDAEISVKDGAVAYNRASREANRDHYRGRDFIKKYGIDFATYQKMLVAQKGVCAICEQPETKIQNSTIRLLSVDHDHKTGAVRGLLCASCNQGVGYFRDDIPILQRAIGYLRRHSGDVVKFEPSIVSGALGSGA